MSKPVRGTVITDASYCHVSKAAGFAAWISMDGNVRVQKAGVIKGSPENATEAELKAALNGLWYAYAHGVRTVLLQTDCMAVVDMVNRTKPNNHSRLTNIFNAAQAQYFPDMEMTARHVKGHTTNEDARSWCNRWCDHHAGRHMRAERKRRRGGAGKPSHGAHQKPKKKKLPPLVGHDERFAPKHREYKHVRDFNPAKGSM